MSDHCDWPSSTYRLQFHAGFTFHDATAVAPYLRDLGIGHVYCSPYLKARAGSTHGYDVTDCARLNDELGTADDYERFCAELRRLGLKQILDTVPNHMGVATNDNPWWNDVLKNGRESRFADYFDIAWDECAPPGQQPKVLLPVLAMPYGEALQSGDLRVESDAGEWFVKYADRRFPLSPASVGAGLDLAINGQPGRAASFDALHDLLDRQAYRLAYWRTAAETINYRRFFDINDLAALATEREDVFEAVHALTFKLVDEGKVSGLRVDHPDGLYDPRGYFERLQKTYARGAGARPPLYVAAEKILAADEQLPSDWAVAGTTGYDFLNKINGLYVDPAGREEFTRRYQAWVGEATTFAELAYEKKRMILKTSLASELGRLGRQLAALADRHRGWRDFTLPELTRALREMIACFPVYRTYIATAQVSPTDRQHVERASANAAGRNPRMGAAVFRFIAGVLLQIYPEGLDEAGRAAQLRFAGRFQQLTAPATAKGIEDTAFYLYNRLVSLNEVGGDPSEFGVSVAKVHEYLAHRHANWPGAMSVLSTHDTKRSEDVRARLNVLSEIPGEWWARVERWRKLNQALRTAAGGAPSADDELLLYQSLLGAWPMRDDGDRGDLANRIVAFMRKAVREGKARSSWTDPNAAYEEAIERFARGLLDPGSGREFLADFVPFAGRVREWGMVNSLSQTLLRLSAPGVADTYQGTELWDLSLVDPDNRRPVDYQQRADYLAEIGERSRADRARLLEELVRERADGRIKMLITWRALQWRRDFGAGLLNASYEPVRVLVVKAEHLFAFARRAAGKTAVVMVARGVAALTEAGDWPVGRRVWGDTTVQLPGIGGDLIDVVGGSRVAVSGGAIAVGEALATLPAALLINA